MLIACIVPCNEGERARLTEALAPQDEVLWFENSRMLENSPALHRIEAVVGEPPVDLIFAMPALRFVQMTWAGVNIYAGRPFPAGVEVANASGAFGKAIAEYVVGGVLALYRNLFSYRAQMINGEWAPIREERTLENERVLILGMGDLGCEIARKLKAFDAQITGVRRTAGSKPPVFDNAYTIEALDTLLPRADLVIGALPGTPATEGLLSKQRLLSMKKSAVVVNVGRGTLVQADTLAEVMNTGHLAGALLDVTDPEPLPAEHPLRRIGRAMITPHISGQSWGAIEQTRQRIIAICGDNLGRMSRGEPIRNRVDLSQGY
ncbi:MAG: D-2-hydroxyacid dehydrogenase [Clostridia bacterium]|nr:D-2-hydroxyacid dehydrogenase [Clostridia bacterium]